MTDRIEAGGLQVDKELYDFINDEALPGTGISPETFWSGFDGLIQPRTTGRARFAVNHGTQLIVLNKRVEVFTKDLGGFHEPVAGENGSVLGDHYRLLEPVLVERCPQMD